MITRYIGAVEVNTVSGFVLEEDAANAGTFLWHKIEANLAHSELPNTTDGHRTACDLHIYGVAHSAQSGHAPCPGCFP